MPAASIRITGVVQGVGFRPNAWRLACECDVTGWVRNDADGVLIHAWGSADALGRFECRLRSDVPRLAQIEQIICKPLSSEETVPAQFQIVPSRSGETHTGVAADAATCPECLSEIDNASDRRYRYPFTNCTHCGPRLTIVEAVPYDRANTSMSRFPMCAACQSEFDDPADRRFHAQPNACPVCGPEVWLEDATGRAVASGSDPLTAAARIIEQGKIVAIKGVGGIHLACDAASNPAVDRLRRRKHRYQKPFALMACDPQMIRAYARLDEAEERLLLGSAAPIVILHAAGSRPLADGIAPGQRNLGFMLPYTPLHHLLMQELSRPIVLTSGNLSDEPQTTDNGEARQRLAGVADFFLFHDRDIVNRLDDSVVRVIDGIPRVLRRARGFAPRPIRLSENIVSASNILAMGGELKNTFSVANDGGVVVSQHMGDLEDAATFRDMQKNLDLYRTLFDFRPDVVAVDMHPDYLSTQLGRRVAADLDIPVLEIQHHHAHIAACMAEHGLAADHGRVLGIALDGLGYGDDGELWGGELLLADYSGYERLAHLEPVPMPGGAQAMREPWRNAYAYLAMVVGWERVMRDYSQLDIVRFLEAKPLAQMQRMLDRAINSPPASSAGRLFDAVAAALGVCRETAGYEGQAAIELESLASENFPAQAASPYPFQFQDGVISSAPMWDELLLDLERKVAPEVMAARFHHGLASTLAATASELCNRHGVETVALGGGVFQNRLLLEQTSQLLRNRGLKALSPSAVPANDGGLSFGQAVIAAR
jgi:hydrogenase maturation protein HypF